jgi:two-component system response regulator FixJ
VTVAKSRVISVVDDDEPVRDSMRLLLESCGFTVRDYSSATQFLEDREALKCCCLVLDLHMPGMSGMELAELLRERGADVPTLLITGKGDPGLQERITHASILTTLHKPVREDVLIQWIEEACAAA